MKKIFKKIIASIMAATLAVGTAGISASAAQFTFTLGSSGSVSITEIKENTLPYSSISITGGNLSNTAYVYFCLKNSSNTAISASTKITGNGSFNLHYATTPPIGTPVTLQISAGYYGGNISGNFTP